MYKNQILILLYLIFFAGDFPLFRNVEFAFNRLKIIRFLKLSGFPFKTDSRSVLSGKLSSLRWHAWLTYSEGHRTFVSGLFVLLYSFFSPKYRELYTFVLRKKKINGLVLNLINPLPKVLNPSAFNCSIND